LTDIRTSIFDEEMGPHDLDVLWNYALQVIFLKVLNPDFSMLKFRPPFGNDIESPVIKWFKEYNETNNIDIVPDKLRYIAKVVKDDLNFVKESYDLDLFGNYLKNKLFYFANDVIYIQPWAPTTSVECRLFVSKKNISNSYVSYDIFEWENKFFYFNMYKHLAYFPTFHSKIKDDIPDYDGCYNCMRELMVLGDYILKTQINDEFKFSAKIDIDTIQELFDDPEVIQRIGHVYKLINRYTYFDLSRGNSKCQHGVIREPLTSVIINFYDGDMTCFYGVSFNKNTSVITRDNIKYKHEIPKMQIKTNERYLWHVYKFMTEKFYVEDQKPWALIKK
jgi:hypothetical protein